jgi:nucleotide-binding universal stress UspA family protein
MAKRQIYLVPVDFSKTSEAALSHAIRLARENKGKLVLLHVISDSGLLYAGPDAGAAQLYVDYQKALEENARRQMDQLLRRRRLTRGGHRAVLIRGGSPARAISEQARTHRASMIVMGSHGRTGVQRLVLGSVAEQTLRYAVCPVLIVKK